MSDEHIVASVLAGLTTKEQKGTKRVAEKAPGGETEGPRTAKRAKKPKMAEHKFPVEPRTIQVIKKPKTFTNHSYRDFSSVPPEIDHVQPTEIDELTFAQKVHHMLSDPENAVHVVWMPHGRSFQILVPKMLEQRKVFLKYFGHNRFSSFLRQLNNYGFKHLTQGADRNCYYHELMLRGIPHLAKYMPDAKDARRLNPDPENEPSLEQISQLFPLPGQQTALLKITTAVLSNNNVSQPPVQQQLPKLQQLGWLSSLGAAAPTPVGVRMLPDDLSKLVSMSQQQQRNMAPVLPVTALDQMFALQQSAVQRQQQQQQASVLEALAAQQQPQQQLQLQAGRDFYGFNF